MRPIDQQETKQRLLAFGLLFLLLAVFSACQLHNLQKKLPPNYADFLSKVRYIITSKEQKAFLKLPDSEKDQFIEEFWKRRNPYPDTEENVFKTEYFNRIDQANKLFLSEGKPGWLTDRGRIYILFGPPMERITSPLSSDPSIQCGEIWYYGGFPVVFRNPSCMGGYELETYDLTALREINLAYMHDLSQALAQAQTEAQGYSNLLPAKSIFDFSLEVKSNIPEPGRIEGGVTIAIPYSGIWLKEEAGILKTEIEVHVELRDKNNQVAWEHKDKIEVALKQTEFKEKQRASYSLEIPFVLEKNVEQLRQGKNTFHCWLKNLTGNEVARKVVQAVF